MKRIRAPLLASSALLVGTSLLLAHDLFFKLESYFVEPHSKLRIPVYNGTFTASEAGVAPERLLDVSLVSPSGRTRLGQNAWTTEETRAWLEVHVGEAGTYVAGASLRPRRIELTAEQFNEYLKEDGILDVLEARTRNNELDRPARERYAKHVKAIFQVGDRRTESYAAVLGYPAEIVPLANPYLLKPGSELKVRCLVDGKPVANQVVFWGGESADGPIAQRSVRTDQDGIAGVTLDRAAKWYVKFVHLVPLAEPEFDYESKWATLTFEIR
jgi:hypothetical protein